MPRASPIGNDGAASWTIRLLVAAIGKLRERIDLDLTPLPCRLTRVEREFVYENTDDS